MCHIEEPLNHNKGQGHVALKDVYSYFNILSCSELMLMLYMPVNYFSVVFRPFSYVEPVQSNDEMVSCH